MKLFPLVHLQHESTSTTGLSYPKGILLMRHSVGNLSTKKCIQYEKCLFTHPLVKNNQTSNN